MDADTLRALQAPLKQKYRDDPGAAVVTLRALVKAGFDESASRVHLAGDRRGRVTGRLTERYCVVLQTLRTQPVIQVQT